MVKSDSGKSVHEVAGGYEESPEIDNFGLQAKGFPDDHNSEQVRGVSEVPDKSGYGTRERDYTTQGDFSPRAEAFKVFSEFFDSPAQALEKDAKGPRTDGGVTPVDNPVNKYSSKNALADVDHKSPFGVQEAYERGRR